MSIECFALLRPRWVPALPSLSTAVDTCIWPINIWVKYALETLSLFLQMPGTKSFKKYGWSLSIFMKHYEPNCTIILKEGFSSGYWLNLKAYAINRSPGISRVLKMNNFKLLLQLISCTFPKLLDGEARQENGDTFWKILDGDERTSEERSDRESWELQYVLLTTLDEGKYSISNTEYSA